MSLRKNLDSLSKEILGNQYCEPSVVCGHIGHIAIYPEDYENWKTTISNYDEVK